MEFEQDMRATLFSRISYAIWFLMMFFPTRIDGLIFRARTVTSAFLFFKKFNQISHYVLNADDSFPFKRNANSWPKNSYQLYQENSVESMPTFFSLFLSLVFFSFVSFYLISSCAMLVAAIVNCNLKN